VYPSFRRSPIQSEPPAAQPAVVEAVEAGLVDVDYAQAEAGLVWFSVTVRVLSSCDVIVTGGKIVAKVRRVTSMRPPTKINVSARRFQPRRC